MHFDVLVIGWGKAGKSVAADLAGAGKKVALVERSASMYGGTCINIGCVPTKDLVVSAEERRKTDEPAAYFEKSVAARDALIAKLRAANYAMLDGHVTLFDGHARFVDSHTVTITPVEGDSANPCDSLEVSAETIVINVGAVTRQLSIEGMDLPGVYDSTTIQHADPFPKRLVVIGSGFIGLEFASMFTDFGAEVTVIDPNEVLLPRVDRDVAASVESSLTGRGVALRLGVAVESISREGEGLIVHTSTGNLPTDAVLVAVGRVPAIDNLGLDAAGIECDDRGFIRVDDHCQTNVPGVFAVGDVNGGPQFTYVSYDDYRIVRDVLLGQGSRVRGDRVAVPWTTFLNPPLSVVGMSEAEATASGAKVLTVTVPIAQIAVMPRPKILGQTDGMMKFIVDAETDRVLGAALHCVDSQELINIVALLIRLGGTVADLRDGIWTHPSSTEAFNGVLKGLKPAN